MPLDSPLEPVSGRWHLLCADSGLRVLTPASDARPCVQDHVCEGLAGGGRALAQAREMPPCPHARLGAASQDPMAPRNWARFLQLQEQGQGAGGAGQSAPPCPPRSFHWAQQTSLRVSFFCFVFNSPMGGGARVTGTHRATRNSTGCVSTRAHTVRPESLCVF